MNGINKLKELFKLIEENTLVKFERAKSILDSLKTNKMQRKRDEIVKMFI